MRCIAFALLALVACGGGGDDDVDPPGEPGHFTISGTVHYEDRPQTNTGPLGDLTEKPSRGISVSLIADANKVVIAETVSRVPNGPTPRNKAITSTAGSSLGNPAAHYFTSMATGSVRR